MKTVVCKKIVKYFIWKCKNCEVFEKYLKSIWDFKYFKKVFGPNPNTFEILKIVFGPNTKYFQKVFTSTSIWSKYQVWHNSVR